MDLESVWDQFLLLLLKENMIILASKKVVAGIPFIYISVDKNLTQQKLERLIKKNAAQVMTGKMLNSETIFVRNEDHMYVYRHRFLVPQQKMFCCGNLCEDCIRLKPYKF